MSEHIVAYQTMDGQIKAAGSCSYAPSLIDSLPRYIAECVLSGRAMVERVEITSNVGLHPRLKMECFIDSDDYLNWTETLPKKEHFVKEPAPKQDFESKLNEITAQLDAEEKHEPTTT